MPIGRGKDGDANRDAYRRKGAIPIRMPIGRVEGCRKGGMLVGMRLKKKQNKHTKKKIMKKKHKKKNGHKDHANTNNIYIYIYKDDYDL